MNTTVASGSPHSYAAMRRPADETHRDRSGRRAPGKASGLAMLGGRGGSSPAMSMAVTNEDCSDGASGSRPWPAGDVATKVAELAGGGETARRTAPDVRARTHRPGGHMTETQGWTAPGW